MSELRPWDRQPSESRQAYHAFCEFRDLPARERSLDRAYTHHRVVCVSRKEPGEIPRPLLQATKCWKTWKRQWNWVARADAHDREIAETERLARRDAIAEMNKRHADIAVAFQQRCVSRLLEIQPNQLSPGLLIRWFEIATLVERRARGEATEIVKHENPRPPMDLSRLTDEELDVFERLLTKVEGAADPAAQASPSSGDTAQLQETTGLDAGADGVHANQRANRREIPVTKGQMP